MTTPQKKAQLLKEDGNKCFQNGDYVGAEAMYSKAIIADSSNPLLFTNRAMARLKLSQWEAVIEDCLSAINLHQDNMKAYYYLAQAQLALHHPNEAYTSALRAFELCVATMDKSLANVTNLVLRCKKERWELREKKRLCDRNELLAELIAALEAKRDAAVQEIHAMAQRGELGTEGVREETESAEKTCSEKIAELMRTFEKAGEDMKKREVPDWAIDDITFAFMHDPVVTKTGHSYERAAIMEHLRRSQTDPLTRSPLFPEELRPNLALRAACEEFLAENGWAVDY